MPYLLNQAAFGYYYSSANPDYVSFSKFKETRVQLAKLYELRKKLPPATSMDSDVAFLSFQITLSSYYEQQLYQRILQQ